MTLKQAKSFFEPCAAAVAAEQMGLKPKVAKECDIELGEYLGAGGEGQVRWQVLSCIHYNFTVFLLLVSVQELFLKPNGAERL